jgi:MerR family transcriptional regulator, heat shock protein HspR
MDMQKKPKKQFTVDIDPDDPVYVIGVVSELIEIPIWTLRKLDEMGVVVPKRFGKKTRCYSHHQIQQLTYVQYLMEEKGVNISGIKVILDMGEI